MHQVTFQTDKSFLSPEEIADHLHISRRTVMRWVEQGMLSALRIGNVTRIPVEAYQRFLTVHLIIGDPTKEISRARPKRRKRTRRKKKSKIGGKKDQQVTALAPLSLTPILFIPQTHQLTNKSRGSTENNDTYPSDVEIVRIPQPHPPPSSRSDSPQPVSDNTDLSP